MEDDRGFYFEEGKVYKEICVKVLRYCNELGLMGGKTFGVDGCRLPSGASIELTGTGEALKKRLGEMAEKHLVRHQKRDEKGEVREAEEKRYGEGQKKLKSGIEKIEAFLESMEKKAGRNGKEIKSNVRDNERALIHTAKGYIPGYIGIAVSDGKSQVIINAEAVGSANECEHFPWIVEKTKQNLAEAGWKEKKKEVIQADSNYISEDNLCAAEEAGMEAIMPDVEYKKRLGKKESRRYNAADYKYQETGNNYICPRGKRLEYKGTARIRGWEGKAYQARAKDCNGCPNWERCVKNKKPGIGRKLLIRASNEPGSL